MMKLPVETEFLLLIYNQIKQEQDPKKNCLIYDTTPYIGCPEASKMYEKGFYDGLECKPRRNAPFLELEGKMRKAYVHGFCTGENVAYLPDE